jgi:hypothetical protein
LETKINADISTEAAARSTDIAALRADINNIDRHFDQKDVVSSLIPAGMQIALSTQAKEMMFVAVNGLMMYEGIDFTLQVDPASGKVTHIVFNFNLNVGDSYILKGVAATSL